MTAALLLIEDTPSLQLVYESVLRTAGHEVQIAADATSGLAAFKATRPPVVILDRYGGKEPQVRVVGDQTVLAKLLVRSQVANPQGPAIGIHRSVKRFVVWYPGTIRADKRFQPTATILGKTEESYGRIEMPSHELYKVVVLGLLP